VANYCRLYRYVPRGAEEQGWRRFYGQFPYVLVVLSTPGAAASSSGGTRWSPTAAPTQSSAWKPRSTFAWSPWPT
jgi:hypothetical protein